MSAQRQRCVAAALLSVLVAALAMGGAAESARADGDPASDVLATQSLFLPWDAEVPSEQQAQLVALLSAAQRTGDPIRVAMIASASDLGSLSALWGKPQLYAEFLATELSLVYHGALLVVMPRGFGVAGFGLSERDLTAALSGIAVPHGGAQFAHDTLTAVERLASARGYRLSSISHLQLAKAKANIGAWIAFLLGVVAIVAAWSASLRTLPLRRRAACGPGLRLLSVIASLAVLAGVGVRPSVAEAHGPLAPPATSYEAKVTSAPPGLDCKVIDGDLRLWMRAAPNQTVVVLDYRGVPYLRFSPSGVYVNRDSEMYYLNEFPVPQTPPASLSAKSPEHWQLATRAHTYSWHDGRLGALSDTAIAPGSTYVGRWTILVRDNGRLKAISGTLWYATSPSLVWFWPVVVLLASLLALVRLGRADLEARLSRLLATGGLLALTVGECGQELHGRPTIEASQLLTLAVVLSFVCWALVGVLRCRGGPRLHMVIAFVALLGADELYPNLIHGFVLSAVPALLARAATVGCLCASSGLALLVVAAALRSSALGRSAPHSDPAVSASSG